MKVGIRTLFSDYDFLWFLGLLFYLLGPSTSGWSETIRNSYAVQYQVGSLCVSVKKIVRTLSLSTHVLGLFRATH